MVLPDFLICHVMLIFLLRPVFVVYIVGADGMRLISCPVIRFFHGSLGINLLRFI